MKRLNKLLSLAMSLVMCAGLVVPALASTYYLEGGDITVSQGYDGGDKEQGYNVTVKQGGGIYGDRNGEVIITNSAPPYESSAPSEEGTSTQEIVETQDSGTGQDSTAPQDTKATSHTVTLKGEVSVTLKDVNIDASGTGKAAVSVGEDSNVTIELDGKNTLKGGDGHAGLEIAHRVEKVPSDTTDGETSDATDGETGDTNDGETDSKTIVHNGNVTIQDDNKDGGSLNATGGDRGAGIGGGCNGTNGTVTVNSGTVTAQGGNEAAGIGGGKAGAGGTVTINKGTVNATGGNGGAGIGGGADFNNSNSSFKEESDRSGGVININGGTVVAQGGGGNGGAGIGGGSHGDGGTITITGGDITATGGSGGAGIGSGTGSHKQDLKNGEYHKGPGCYYGGDITIGGSANVTAIGGWLSAGIGGGYCADSGNILINGGTVKAYGGNDGGIYQGGAGIGGGYEGHGNVTIQGGNVTAYAVNKATIDKDGNIQYTEGSAAAGIGSGATANNRENDSKPSLVYDENEGCWKWKDATYSEETGRWTSGSWVSAPCAKADDPSSVKWVHIKGRGEDAHYQDGTVVSITGGEVEATGGNAGGAGIGGGFGADKVEVNISGGTVTAKGGAGSFDQQLAGTSITDPTIGGAGIGSGCNSKGIKDAYSHETDVTVTITGGEVTATGGWGAAGIGSGADNKIAKSVTIGSNAKVQAFADGIKFAIDSYNRGENEVVPVTGGNILQGTFMVVSKNGSPINSKGEIGLGDYSGLYVVIYKDADPSSTNDSLKAYETPVDGFQLPEGYRSFAVTVDQKGDYLVYGSEGDFKAWFGFDTEGAQETTGVDKQTGHYNTADSSMSDNYWLYELPTPATIVPDPVDDPDPSETTTIPTPPNETPGTTPDDDPPTTDIPEEETPTTEPDPEPAPEEEIPDEEPPLVDIPDEEPPVEEEIPDEEPPLVDVPKEEPPVVEIPDEQPPLVTIDDPVPVTEIPEEDVPLANVPQTGDYSLAWYAAALVSAFGLAVLTLRKREDEEV